jgi:hypothetical protein
MSERGLEHTADCDIDTVQDTYKKHQVRLQRTCSSLGQRSANREFRVFCTRGVLK